MDIEHILAFNLALGAALLSPGPAFLVTVQTTLSSGRRAGMAVGLGLGLTAASWTLAALLGLNALFDAFPWAYAGAKTLGALYLLFIAWKMWTHAEKPVDLQARPARRAFRSGLLINLLNPKAMIFAAAVLVVVLPKEITPLEQGAVVANQLSVELVFYSAVAFAMSTGAVSRAYLAAKRWIDRISGAVLGALGARLLTEK